MPLEELKWYTLTPAINEMKSPNMFLTRLLYPNHDPLPTEDIEVASVHKGRETAPFVRKNGEAIMVQSVTEKSVTVAAPNIRIKRPFTPSELLFGRSPGTVQYASGAGQVLSNVQMHIARDLKVMADLITNATEYLVAMSLRGQISYEVADQEVFQITLPRSVANNIALTTGWNEGASARPLANIHAVKRILSEEGVTPTDAICGTEAASALLELVEAGHLKWAQTPEVITAGNVSFLSQFSDDGAILLGSIAGVRFWEYGRKVLHNGVVTDLVRPDYVEFVTTSAAAERVLYFGAIPDMKALQGRLFQGERFSKSWEIEDPSSMMALAHSRPLPVPRRPDTQVSMKVITEAAGS